MEYLVEEYATVVVRYYQEVEAESMHEAREYALDVGKWQRDPEENHIESDFYVEENNESEDLTDSPYYQSQEEYYGL